MSEPVAGGFGHPPASKRTNWQRSIRMQMPFAVCNTVGNDITAAFLKALFRMQILALQTSRGGGRESSRRAS